VQRARKATKPTRGSQRRRVDSKVKRGQVKAARGRVTE
jgi:ribosome-associated protein